MQVLGKKYNVAKSSMQCGCIEMIDNIDVGQSVKI